MQTCPFCHQPASKRDGHDAAGRQRYACHACRRDFTERSASAFAGYRWPAEVILLAVRWSLSHPLSATSVMELLAERGIDVSKRTVLRWVQTFGPLLAAEVRKHRRPLGRTLLPYAPATSRQSGPNAQLHAKHASPTRTRPLRGGRYRLWKLSSPSGRAGGAETGSTGVHSGRPMG